jgi:hypothetical protein
MISATKKQMQKGAERKKMKREGQTNKNKPTQVFADFGRLCFVFFDDRLKNGIGHGRLMREKKTRRGRFQQQTKQKKYSPENLLIDKSKDRRRGMPTASQQRNEFCRESFSFPFASLDGDAPH